MNAQQHKFIHPGSLQAGLIVTKVKPGWYIGRTFGGTLFARTRGELIFKYRSFVQTRRQHIRATGAVPVLPSGNPPPFLQFHGFGGGQRVRLHAYAGGPDDGRIYTIGMVGYQSNGDPAAWLNGWPGAVPLTRLSHVPSPAPAARASRVREFGAATLCCALAIGIGALIGMGW